MIAGDPRTPFGILVRATVALAVAACSACDAEDAPMAGAAKGTSIGAAAVCAADADCPAPANTCYAARCTTGACVAVAVGDGKPCDDGNACNSGDACKAGLCAGGSDDKVCNDGDACTADWCEPAVGCTAAPLTTKCNDNNPCTIDVCAAGACSNTPADTAVCDDGNACTSGDKCAAGKCKPGPTTPCDDANPCTTDSCDPDLGCIVKVNTAPCSDNDACTKGDECVDGECRGGKTIVSCDDANPCTADACDKAKGCTSAAAVSGTACDDGNACTAGDTCLAGACKAGAALLCDDTTPCTIDACDPKTGCTHTSSSAACDDGNACTSGDSCKGGACAGGAAKNCDDGNGCTVDSCDPKTGCAMAGATTACDDGNACTTGDTCKDKSCGAGAGKPDCDDKNPCTTDSCDPKTGCAHAINTLACDDSDPKTSGDVCMNGKCMGTPVPTDLTPTCAAYCDAVLAACGASGPNAQFGSKSECESWCADQAKWPAGLAGDKSGNTIGCRASHAALAKADAGAAALHCPHAGKTGGNVCGTWCDNYCQLASLNCSMSLGYANNGACMQACKTAPVNKDAGNTGDYSLQCMIVQGGAAANDVTLCAGMTIGGSGTGKCKHVPVTVKVITQAFAFSPKDVTIMVGDAVEFALGLSHNAVEVDKATWESNGAAAKAGGFSVDFGATKSITFDKAGTYYYVCAPHAGGGMKGSITVQ